MVAGGGNKSELERLLVRRGFGATLGVGASPAPSPAGNGPVAVRAGTLTELVPSRPDAAGLTSLALHLAARIAGRLAWIDPNDRLDPESAERAGLCLAELLWIRGPRPGPALERALQAAQLLLQAGGFSLLVLDLLEQGEAAGRIPRASWFRLLRALERQRSTALLVLASRPLTGSCADQVLAVAYSRHHWSGAARPLLEHADLEIRLCTERRPAERRPPGRAGAPWRQAFFVA